MPRKTCGSIGYLLRGRSNIRKGHRWFVRSHPRYAAPQSVLLLAIRTNQTGSGDNTPDYGQLGEIIMPEPVGYLHCISCRKTVTPKRERERGNINDLLTASGLRGGYPWKNTTALFLPIVTNCGTWTSTCHDNTACYLSKCGSASVISASKPGANDCENGLVKWCASKDT